MVSTPLEEVFRRSRISVYSSTYRSMTEPIAHAEVQRGSLRETADAHARKRAHFCEEDDVGNSIRSGDIDIILQAIRPRKVIDTIRTHLRSVKCDAVFGAIIIRKFLTSSCTMMPTDPLRATML